MYELDRLRYNCVMDDATRTRISKMVPLLDERQRRIYLALESESLGRGGVDEVRELTGIGRNSLFDGRREARGQIGRAHV